MKFKKIKFIPTSEYTGQIEIPPSNAASVIPEWYKSTPKFIVGSNEHNDVVKAYKESHISGDPSNIHSTLKQCQPFIDTLTSGYVIKLPAAILVHKDEFGNSIIRWETSFNVVDHQDNKVLGKFKAPDGYFPQFFRWVNMWKIQTPPGYSSLFTHPLNRFDLPFITLSAVVDTDMHPNSVIIPFFIKNDFEGIIEEGTPIAQVLPFKRDNWESSIEQTDHSQKYAVDAVKTSFFRTYRKKFWSKKIYR